MDLTIYTLIHKHFTKPDDNMYVPLQVGTAINSPLGYLRDDTGDNISALNGYYSELTGLYWIWKMCMILIMLEHAITEDILLMRTSIL